MAKWIECKKCGHEYSSDIKECPKCYNKTPVSFLHLLKYLIVAILVLITLTFAIAGFFDDGVIHDDTASSSSQQTHDNDKSTQDSSAEPFSSDNTENSSDTEFDNSLYVNTTGTSEDASSVISSDVSSSVTSESANENTENITYVPFTLPMQFDAEMAIKSLDSAYFPMSFYSVNSAFQASPYYQSYISSMAQEHYHLRIGSRLPKCIIYKFEFRGYVEDLDAAKSMCSKYFDDNLEHFKGQFETIKKYARDVDSFQVAFEFVPQNDSWYSEIIE